MIIIDYNRLSKIIKDYQRLSKIIIAVSQGINYNSLNYLLFPYFAQTQ
jgi:hypothetical protein